MNRLLAPTLALVSFLSAGPALAQKVMLNPSSQTWNVVSGGGNEAQYALDCANRAKTILDGAGFAARVDQDFKNAPLNANSWGANIFVSMHTNAGGGHGTETIYVSTAGKTLAGRVQNGLLSKLPYAGRGLVYRDNLYVLNATNMPACLTEALFHDCTAGSGYTGHPPSESSFLRSADGRQKIAAGTATGVCTHFNKSCTPAPPPPPPPPAKGWLKGVVYKNPNIDSHLSPATIKLNTGATTTYNGTTVWSLEVPAGTYTVTASASGYQSGSITRTVAAGQTVYASIGLDPAVAPVQKGWLKGSVYKAPNLSDVLAGAVVKLNTGATATYNGVDNWAFEVPVGSYTVTATKSGFKTASVTKAVTAGGTTWASIGLEPTVAPPPPPPPPPPDGAEDGGVVDPNEADAGDGWVEEPPPEGEWPPDDADGGMQDPPAAASLTGEMQGSYGCSTAGGAAIPLLSLLMLGLLRRRVLPR